MPRAMVPAGAYTLGGELSGLVPSGKGGGEGDGKGSRCSRYLQRPTRSLEYEGRHDWAVL